MYKRSKYGKLPAKIAEKIPRNKHFVQIIDNIYHKTPYVIKNRERKNFNP